MDKIGVEFEGQYIPVNETPGDQAKDGGHSSDVHQAGDFGIINFGNSYDAHHGIQQDNRQSAHVCKHSSAECSDEKTPEPGPVT